MNRSNVKAIESVGGGERSRRKGRRESGQGLQG